MNYQKLFDYLSDEHGVTLLESDMSEIINIVNEMQQAPKWRPIEQVLDFGYNIHVVCKERERKLYKAVEITKYTKLESMIHFYSEFIIIPKQ
jgi:mevalonate pyrophosphate decarboxylase